MLEVRELSKSFGGLKAVDQASLDVRQGEIVGLIGPNGWVIWKVRTMPAAQMRCGGKPVMSLPSKATRPASGV